MSGTTTKLRRPRIEKSQILQRVPKETCTEFCVIALNDPVVDPLWLSRHPRFQLERKTARQLPQIERQFYAKRIINRVKSNSGNRRNSSICHRKERNEASSTCRYCCELLGPNLCKDCSKLFQRNDAVREFRYKYPREMENPAARDPFHLFIASREKQAECNDSEEEVFEETEDEEFGSMPATPRQTPVVSPWRHDSGYTSRMSYIRSLSRTPSACFRDNVESASKQKRHVISTGQSELRTFSDRDRALESTAMRKNVYIAKLRERKGFKNVLQDLYDPRGVRHAWKSLPVEPVEMELKFINFTIYDNAKINQRKIQKVAELDDNRANAFDTTKLVQDRYRTSKLY